MTEAVTSLGDTVAAKGKPMIAVLIDDLLPETKILPAHIALLWAGHATGIGNRAQDRGIYRRGESVVVSVSRERMPDEADGNPLCDPVVIGSERDAPIQPAGGPVAVTPRIGLPLIMRPCCRAWVMGRLLFDRAGYIARDGPPVVAQIRSFWPNCAWIGPVLCPSDRAP